MRFGGGNRLFGMLPWRSNRAKGIYVMYPPGWATALFIALLGSALSLYVGVNLRHNLLDAWVACTAISAFTGLLTIAVGYFSGPRIVISPQVLQVGYWQCDQFVFTDQIRWVAMIPRLAPPARRFTDIRAMLGVPTWRIVVESRPTWDGSPSYVVATLNAAVTNMLFGHLWLRRLSRVLRQECQVPLVAVWSRPHLIDVDDPSTLANDPTS